VSTEIDDGALEEYIERDVNVKELFPKGLDAHPKYDTYWVGKSIGKHSNVLAMAEQIDRLDIRDHLIEAIKNELEDWFDGHAPRHFYYNDVWRTLIGYPDSYMSGGQMNDHHFHYAYFIMGAATVARYDAAWAKKYAPMVDLLIKDPANWDRSDKRFPFLRQMDPYAGHSWANGPSLFGEGNNQEASSEDTNFSTAVILWGEASDNDEIRDLGMFLYANQVEAIGQYWFDVDEKVHPKNFKHPALAIVWGAGGWYNTWFDEDPNVIHGINYLPFTGGSLYHGRWPDYVKRNYDYLAKINRNEIWTWRDYVAMFLALGDPAKAVELFDADPHFKPEYGNTTAMFYHWVYNLKELGRVDLGVTADVSTFAVFKKDTKRTYVAFNPHKKTCTVHFSDGMTLKVPGRQTVWKTKATGKKSKK
jgi:endoglucanase Acf2